MCDFVVVLGFFSFGGEGGRGAMVLFVPRGFGFGLAIPDFDDELSLKCKDSP